MTDVDKIAVLGAGDMGHGIAELAAIHGYQVTLRDIEEEVVDEALDKVEWSLDKLVDKDEITEQTAQRALDSLRGTTDLADAVSEVDMVIEAVPEDLSLKQKVFADVETHVDEDTVLASNTSTMRITEIGEKLDRPQRIVGMHFFNPVLLMDLVEVIPSESASDQAVAAVEDVAEQMGKTTVTLNRDTPGFVTSRLVGAFVKSAIRAREAELATAAEIDAAMTFDAGFLMGPFELADYTGLDIGLHASEYIAERLGEAYAPTDVQRGKVEAGDLGKKTGRGFYEWDGDQAQIELTPEMAESFDEALVLASVANEAARLLGENVATAEDIDRAMKLGAAFPQGPLRWADGFGLDTVADKLEEFHEATGDPLAEPADELQARIDAGNLGEDAGEGFFIYEKGEREAPTYEAVKVSTEPEAHLGWITLDRPHRMNAINDQLVQDVETALDELDANDDVRAIIIQGEGDHFCVGADLQSVGDFEPADAAQLARNGHQMCNAMAQLETPVIAAVDGYAFGGGLELTLPADFRLASSRAKFQLPEVTLGLLPAMGATFRLPKLIGTSHAKEIAVLGDRISAKRAHEMGLVHRVWENDEFEDKVRAFAEKLTTRAPIAVRTTRNLVDAGHDASARQGMEAEANAFGMLASTDDVIEGITAMMQDREPEFTGE